jgi:hypothetical protein
VTTDNFQPTHRHRLHQGTTPKIDFLIIVHEENKDQSVDSECAYQQTAEQQHFSNVGTDKFGFPVVYQ